jgi:FlaA1/EpsC-like NDP-sugar epimerase
MRSAAFPVHRHALPQLVMDGVLAALAYFLAYWVRFEGHFHGKAHRYERLLTGSIWWVVIVCLVALAVFGQYQRLWKFVGQRDYEAVLKAVLLSTLVIVGIVALFHPIEVNQFHNLVISRHPRQVVHEQIGTTAVSLPASIIVLFFLLAVALLIGARFALQVISDGRIRSPTLGKNARQVLIVGGGEGGRLVVRELLRNPELNLRPVGFLDDDPRKLGSKDEHGLKILGATTDPDLSRVLDELEPDEVVIAIPSASGELRGRVVTASRARGIPVRTTPTVFELLRDGSGQLRVTRQLRQVRVEDILGREPVREQLEQVGAYLRGRTVLVTGAGGSIGSELCRQIARVGPQRLILVDHAEDNLFEIQRELEEDRHVRTAAYKHVGMMELNPVEAIRNNALATRLVARIAGELGVGTFVLISTDKAVEPKTVMGASKALAEWAVEATASAFPGTRFATVRFGNVLGSSGSVVPIFRRQIAAGGPVTVTDERMKRYFMTIPEAVQLVIRAGSLGDRSGDVYVLEMGEPMRIVELAEQMIRLSGLEPNRDIAIEITGARPGEKFDEQLFGVHERVHPTPAPRIQRADHDPLDPRWVRQIFDDINLLVLEGDASALAKHVAELSGARVTLGETDPTDPRADRATP